MHGKFYERQPVFSGDDVSGNAGIRRMADRTWEDGGSGSCDVRTLYWDLYQPDTDSIPSYSDDPQMTDRIPQISACSSHRAGDRECTGRRINR